MPLSNLCSANSAISLNMHYSLFFITNLMLTTKLKRSRSYLLGFVLSMGYAGLDEWHQTFIPGRTGHAIDVFTFDMAGILLALALTFFLRWCFRILIK
ncbi:VanZ family protein [Terrilactibacillus sp. S3-3]|nr:VanZ family protein [Terrilactibacillus sp. S3-3]